MVQVRALQPINTDGSINLESWLDHVLGMDPALDRSALREACEFARIMAEDLFSTKVDILREMSRLDPEGPWLERGARALDNPRTSTGEESLEKLFAILDQLKEGGRQSEAFWNFKKKLSKAIP